MPKPGGGRTPAAPPPPPFSTWRAPCPAATTGRAVQTEPWWSTPAWLPLYGCHTRLIAASWPAAAARYNMLAATHSAGSLNQLQLGHASFLATPSTCTGAHPGPPSVHTSTPGATGLFPGNAACPCPLPPCPLQGASIGSSKPVRCCTLQRRRAPQGPEEPLGQPQSKETLQHHSCVGL
jgi:hypothetical protein